MWSRRSLTRWSVVVGLVMAVGLLPLGQGWAADAQGVPDGEHAGSLRAMLQRAPDILHQPNVPTAQFATYSNVEARLAVTGVQAPSPQDDEEVSLWMRAVDDLLLPDFRTHSLNPEWRETFGFDIFQIDQSLEIGEPPTMTTFLRGRFDEAELRTAWEQSGYRELDVNGISVMSVGPQGELALDTTIGRLALSRLNNAVILDDGTLVFSATLANIQAVLAVEAGQANSLADRAEIVDLVEGLEVEVSSAMLLHGTALRGMALDPVSIPIGGTPEADFGTLATQVAEREAELGQMPPVMMALLGVTAEGALPPPITAVDDEVVEQPEGEPGVQPVIALHMGHQNAAEAAARVVSERLETQLSLRYERPWAELFPEREVGVASDVPVVLIDLGPPVEARANVIFFALFTRDLGFVAW